MVEIEEGFGAGVSIPEPVNCRGVPDARYHVLEDVYHPGLGVGEDVSHILVHRTVLELDLRQLDFFGANPDVRSLGVFLLFREAHVTVHHSSDCLL